MYLFQDKAWITEKGRMGKAKERKLKCGKCQVEVCLYCSDLIDVLEQNLITMCSRVLQGHFSQINI